jgi:DGQHR domain-containing protein
MQTKLDLVDPDRIEKRFKVLTVRQPIGDIYVASVDFKSIQEITYFDVRRRLQDERDIEKYLGIQRPLNGTRVKELNQYVNFIDATFPGTIIVSVENDYSWYDEETGEIVVSNTKRGDDKPSIPIRNVGRVIDGQHRIAGLEKFDASGSKNFDVIVSFFVGSDISDQAYVFATVNLEQTKVNKSLAYDLFELAKSRSPYKTCHNIAVALDRLETSPFYQKIKRLGSSTDDERGSETLTQATFVNQLVDYISKDPKQDRDDILTGRNLQMPTTKELERLVFRGLFVNGEDVKIGKIYEEYFQAIKAKWQPAWDYTGKGIMLSRTNGYRAFGSVFGKVYLNVARPGEVVDRVKFAHMLNRVNLKWEDFNTDKFKPGSSGESELRRILLDDMGIR